MGSGPLVGAVRLLRQLDDSSLTDRQLLEEFASGDRARPFGRLVERHGAMVYGVCKRVLRNTADADDAFQATFLVLAKKARSRGWHDSAANYLYGVAYHIAVRARGREARRKHHEERVPSRQDSTPDDRVSVQELRSAVDEELTRLPEKLRLPVLLCCIHDRTIEEAATTLGLSATTVKGRLQQGRDALRARLAGRGITVGAGVLAAQVFGGTATAVPPTLLTETVQLAASGSVVGSVAVLTNEEFAMLFWKKAKTLTVVLGVFAAICGGVMTLTTSAAPLPETPLPVENRAKAPAPADAERPTLMVSIATPRVNNIQDLHLSGKDATLAVVVTNLSSKPVSVWRDWCSWGYFNITLEFCDETAAAGPKYWVIAKAPRGWDKNFPDAAEVAPGGSMIFNVPLSESMLKDADSLQKYDGKKLKMRVHYSIAANKEAQEFNVWTGRVQSTYQEYTVRK